MVERTRIEETTVGYVPGVSIGVGNIFVRDFQAGQGNPGRGPTARLAVRPDDPAASETTLTVYRGQELTLGQRRYRGDEVALTSEGSDNGYVELVGLDG